MKKEMIDKRLIGVNFSTDEIANILLWAPYALSVDLEIEEKSILPLEVGEYGFWNLKTKSLRPGDKYFFKIDNKNPYADPASLYQPLGVHGPSEAFNLDQFQWNDGEWKGINKDELIIYELHIGTFTQDGTFEGVISRIPYFEELGITAIELMPIAQFPGSRNWGYDGVYPFAVQDSYGGPKGFQHLIDTFHQARIGVILDVVYNHLGPEGNYLTNYAPYFTGKYRTPWGDAINFDDEWCDGVRQFYIENALMWLRDFHVDALRLDAVHAIKDFGARHILEDIKRHVKELNTKSGKHHFLIGESDLNDVRYINPPEQGGYNLDHQWVDEFHHALHSLVSGEKNGYYSDFGGITFLEKSFNDAYVYDGLYSPYRKKTFGNKTSGQPKEKFIVFAQNHDQIGNRIKGDRLSKIVEFEMLKLIAGTLFISPFIPMIFMGEEYGETNPFIYFTSHGDYELIELVREGRKKEFEDFINGGETFHDPQSTETFNNSKISLNTNEGKGSLFNFYKELIRLKKHHPVIVNSRRENMVTQSLKMSNVLLHLKKTEDHFVAAIINFEKQEYILDFIPWGDDTLKVLLNSADQKWGSVKNNDPSKDKESNILSIQLRDFIEPPLNNINKSYKPPFRIAPVSIVLLSDIGI